MVLKRSVELIDINLCTQIHRYRCVNRCSQLIVSSVRAQNKSLSMMMYNQYICFSSSFLRDTYTPDKVYFLYSLIFFWIVFCSNFCVFFLFLGYFLELVCAMIRYISIYVFIYRFLYIYSTVFLCIFLATKMNARQFVGHNLFNEMSSVTGPSNWHTCLYSYILYISRVLFSCSDLTMCSVLFVLVAVWIFLLNFQ